MSMENDDVNAMDLLYSMSQSLMDIKPTKIFVEREDREFSIKVGGKPPRQTIVVASDPIPEYIPELCSCEYLCSRGRATLKCLTCALYDPKGEGYYCEACFNARHPWYRVAHIFGPIYRNEDIGNSLKIQHHDLQLDRQRIENLQIVDNLKRNKLTLEVVADDVVVDDNIRKAARKSLELESKMHQMRAKLRANVRATGGKIEWNESEATVVMQKLIRGYRIRKLISRAIAERTMKVWDASSGREFFYDRFTGESSWTPSRLMRRKDVDDLPLLQEAGEDRTKWATKRSNRRARSIPVHEPDEAAQVLIGFFRGIIARMIVVKKASELYRRVFDEDYGTYFYAHTLTGESFWEKPKVFLTTEPDLLLTEEQNKRSPRVNREKIDNMLSGLLNRS